MGHSDHEEYQEEGEEQEEQVEEEPQGEEEEETAAGDGEEQEEECGVEKQFWQWSDCTGNKKAFLVGINYFGTDSELNGCINDVHNLKAFISERGYEEEHTLVLTDDQEDEDLKPTKENILKGMKWLVEGASPNDALFFHFSGHGGSEVDETGDEHDGHDETIAPVDYTEAGTIKDDDLHAILVAPLPIGCRLTVIFDCCHSGSALDLPYTYTTEGTIKEPSAAEHLENIAHHMASGDVDALVKSAQSLQLVQTGYSEEAHSITKATRSSPADVIFLSGCQDEQTSADSSVNGTATGALSWAFIKVFNENSDLTYQAVLEKVQEALHGKYSQKPQLSSSHPMDINLEFVL